jgi:hypothetical protein
MPWQAPESHTIFGTEFCAPNTHTFWRNRASGAEEGQLDLYEDVAAVGRQGAVFSGEDRIQLSGPADMECAGIPSLRDQTRAKLGKSNVAHLSGRLFWFQQPVSRRGIGSQFVDVEWSERGLRHDDH